MAVACDNEVSQESPVGEGKATLEVSLTTTDDCAMVEDVSEVEVFFANLYDRDGKPVTVPTSRNADGNYVAVVPEQYTPDTYAIGVRTDSGSCYMAPIGKCRLEDKKRYTYKARLESDGLTTDAHINVTITDWNVVDIEVTLQ